MTCIRLILTALHSRDPLIIIDAVPRRMYAGFPEPATLPAGMILDRFIRAASAVALVVLAMATSPGVCRAQDAGERIAVTVAEENFRAAAGGTLIAVLAEGAVLTGGGTRDRWRQATLEAWVAGSAVSSTTRDGFDLVVLSGGATLHASADGPAIGRGLAGMLLDDVSRDGSWIQVRRTGWIWAPSIGPAPAAAPRAAQAARPTARPASDPPAAGAAPVAAPMPPPEAVRGELVLHAEPAGSAVGTLGSDAAVEVVGREGDWARVRVEGWVLSPEGSAINAPAPLSNVTLDAMRQAPDRYRGQTIAWNVQFVALQTADSLRTDMSPGERYMLARDPGGSPGFVYISVPDVLLAGVRRLVPLQRIQVIARVRTGRSALMGHPILELIEIR
jgi:hypothetical protein